MTIGQAVLVVVAAALLVSGALLVREARRTPLAEAGSAALSIVAGLALVAMAAGTVLFAFDVDTSGWGGAPPVRGRF